jgi:hypothetical protein
MIRLLDVLSKEHVRITHHCNLGAQTVVSAQEAFHEYLEKTMDCVPGTQCVLHKCLEFSWKPVCTVVRI